MPGKVLCGRAEWKRPEAPSSFSFETKAFQRVSLKTCLVGDSLGLSNSDQTQVWSGWAKVLDRLFLKRWVGMCRSCVGVSVTLMGAEEAAWWMEIAQRGPSLE